MRYFRLLLLRALVATVLMVAVLAALAFVPAVQTWVIERSLASHSPLDLQLGRAWAYPGHLQLENLELRTGGFSLKASKVDAELSLFALLRGRLECRSLRAEGLRAQCNVSQSEASGTLGGLLPTLLREHGADAATAGPMPGLRLIELDQLKLSGELRVAFSPAHPPGNLRFSLEGGGLGAGREARYTLGIESRDASLDTLGRVSGNFGLILSLDAEGRLIKLATTGGMDAEGGLLSAPAKLGLDGLLEGSPSGRRLHLQLSEQSRRLASIEGGWAQVGGGFSGSWALNLKDSDLAPFLPAGSLPRFELSGGGNLAAQPSAARLQLSGKLEGGLDCLERLGPSWPALGRISLRSEFDLEAAASLLLVRSLNLGLGAGEAQLELRAERAFSADLARRALVHQSEQGRLLSASFSRVPAKWIQWVAPSLSLSGGDLSGGFAVECREDGWSVTSLSPVEGRGLSLEAGGTAMLRDVDLSLETRLDVLAGGWQVEFSKLRIAGGDGILFDGILRLGRLSEPGSPLLSMGRCELDLPSCARQPACSWLAPLARGHAKAEFQLIASGKLEGHGVIRADDLVSAGDEGKLPALAVELGLQRGADGVLSIEAPVRIGGGDSGASELRLSGTLRPGDEVLGIDLSVTGGRLLAAHLRPLLGGLFRAPASPRAAPGTGCPWSGLQGVVQFNLAQCVVDGQRRLEPLSGLLRVSPALLRFEQFKARQLPGAGGLQVEGTLAWEDGRYRLEAGFAADSLDMGGFLQLAGCPEWNGLSARFDAKGSVHAVSAGFDSLLTDCSAQFELLSKGGTCRVLGTDLPSILAKKPAASTGLSSSIGSLLGLRSQAQPKESQKLDEPSRMALDLAEYFARIPFDQLSLNLERRPGGELRLVEVSLIAPLVRLSGSGIIGAKEGSSFLSRPLDLRLGVLVRGRFSEMLGKAGQLDGTQDPLGYNGFAEGVRIGGSLAAPDTSDLRNRLLKVSFSKSSDDFFRRLLGGR
jgi:hypothetical protein